MNRSIEGQRGRENASKVGVCASLFESAMRAYQFIHENGQANKAGEVFVFYQITRDDKGSVMYLTLGGAIHSSDPSVNNQVLSGNVYKDSFDVEFIDEEAPLVKRAESRLGMTALVRDLLTQPGFEEQRLLASKIIDRSGLNALTHAFPRYYHAVAEAYRDMPERQEILLDAVTQQRDAEESGIEPNVDTQRMISAINEGVARLLADDRQIEAGQLFHQLQVRGLLADEVLTSIEIMARPEFTVRVSERTEEKDIFEDIDLPIRHLMADLLVYSLLKHLKEDETRHTANLDVIMRTLFDVKSYKRELRMKDLLLLANGITKNTNVSSGSDNVQDTLPVDDIGPRNLINCGEALFRILAITATTDEHIAQNRAFSKIFDSLLQQHYKEFEVSRPVTIADICARYPDVEGDLVFEFDDVDVAQGLSLATKQYRTVKKQYGDHVSYRKHRPGYGIIT